MEYINIIFLNFLSCLIILLNGIAFKKLLNFKKINENLLEAALYGIISISIFTFIVNFFTKISNLVSIIILLIPILFSIREFFQNKKEAIIICICVGLISSIIMYFDNTNRPDAGLYHLPFINIINESKIIIGSANLEFRYGHTSILQYLSAAFNNIIFSERGVLLPLANIFSIVILYFINLINKSDNLIKIIFFIFLFNILYSMNRYSGLGNDDPGHMYYYLAVCNFIYFYSSPSKEKIINVIFFSLFAFLIKPFLILIFLFPLILLLEKKIKLFSINNFLCLFIISIWLLKNILISSCAIYPMTKSCIKDLEWSTYKSEVSNPERVSRTSEAWAKDWPNKKFDIDQREYIKNFKWLNTWRNNHFKVFLKEIIPQIIFLVILIFISGKIFENNLERKLKLKIFIISLVSICLWFVKFPIYRYGQGYIITFLNASFLLFVSSNFKFFNFKKKNLIKSINLFLLLVLIIIFCKNVLRIYKNLDYKYLDYPWPKMYSFTKMNEKNTNKKVYSNYGEFLYYKPFPYSLCMFSNSPCTSNVNVGEIYLRKKLGYKIFYKKN